jgi:hypothetical protein
MKSFTTYHINKKIDYFPYNTQHITELKILLYLLNTNLFNGFNNFW